MTYEEDMKKWAEEECPCRWSDTCSVCSYWNRWGETHNNDNPRCTHPNHPDRRQRCVRCGCPMKFDSIKGWVDLNGNLYLTKDGKDDHCHLVDLSGRR